MQRSAGLLLYRRSPDLEVFLAHPGGPFWASRDAGAWTIPKGSIDPGEEPLDCAIREFTEETGIVPKPPFTSLGTVVQRSGKEVAAWAWEGDADPTSVKSNSVRIQWPRGSGRTIVVPEVDRCEWFDVETAAAKINQAQAEFLSRLVRLLASA